MDSSHVSDQSNISVLEDREMHWPTTFVSTPSRPSDQSNISVLENDVESRDEPIIVDDLEDDCVIVEDINVKNPLQLIRIF